MNMSVENLKFFLSVEQECSYLPDRKSASVFADPEGKMDTPLYSILINYGFRRSADYVYRPHCPSCRECKPARILASEFHRSRSQKRVWKKNQNLTIKQVEPTFKEEHFQLYRKYVHVRHTDGEMDHQDENRYLEFLCSTWCKTAFYEFRLNQQLVAVAVTDILTHGLSALYTFFDPEFEHLSPGTYAVLWQIEKARQLKLPYVYLGYWIKDCQKMKYKNRFTPLELWENDGWKLYEKK